MLLAPCVGLWLKGAGCTKCHPSLCVHDFRSLAGGLTFTKGQPAGCRGLYLLATDPQED